MQHKNRFTSNEQDRQDANSAGHPLESVRLHSRFVSKLAKVNGRRQFKLLCIVWVLAALVLATPLFAQNGTIQGTVVDSSGAIIPNAAVKATDQQKGVVLRATTTNASGEFQLQPLGPGIYTIEISTPGMASLKRTDVNLDIAQTLNLGSIAV